MKSAIQLGVGVCVLLLTAEPTPARACSGAPCSADQFLPATGSLPQNAPAIGVFIGVDSISSNDGGPPTLVRTTQGTLTFKCTDSAGTSSDVPFELSAASSDCEHPLCDAELSSIAPKATLPVGGTCELVGNTCDDRGAGFSEILAGTDHLWSHASFEVTPPADLPTTLGTLELAAAKRESIALAGGSGCYDQLDSCVVRAEVELSAEAKPWRDALAYTTYVDGKPWYVSQMLQLPRQLGGSYLGRGKELFYYKIAEPNPAHRWALSRGEHVVTMRATLAGTNLVLETAPQTLKLDCGDAPGSTTEPPPGDGGPALDPDGGVRTTGDADAATHGGAVDPDGGPHGDGDDEEERRRTGARQGSLGSGSGCSVCRIGPTANESSAFAVVLTALALVAARGTRRRRRS